jgi:hypothetical protein
MRNGREAAITQPEVEFTAPVVLAILLAVAPVDLLLDDAIYAKRTKGPSASRAKSTSSISSAGRRRRALCCHSARWSSPC